MKIEKGFTLIELLIVIVIIGILAGVVLSVLNPAKAQRKSNETVLVANVEKMCLGMFSCFNTTTDPTKCDRFDEIGVSCSNPPSCTRSGLDGTPEGSYYRIWHSTAGKYMYVYGILPAGPGSDGKRCYPRCWYYYETGVSRELQEYKNSTYDCLIDF